MKIFNMNNNRQYKYNILNKNILYNVTINKYDIKKDNISLINIEYVKRHKILICNIYT